MGVNKIFTAFHSIFTRINRLFGNKVTSSKIHGNFQKTKRENIKANIFLILNTHKKTHLNINKQVQNR